MAMADAEGDSIRFTSFSSLLQNVGRLGRPSGRGLLMFRTLIVSATTAGMVGLCAGYVGGMYPRSQGFTSAHLNFRHASHRRRKSLRAWVLSGLCHLIDLLLQKPDTPGIPCFRCLSRAHASASDDELSRGEVSSHEPASKQQSLRAESTIRLLGLHKHVGICISNSESSN